MSRTLKKYREQGATALHEGKRTGAPTRLSLEQLNQLVSKLHKGAEHHGFSGSVWTRPRVNAVRNNRTAAAVIKLSRQGDLTAEFNYIIRHIPYKCVYRQVSAQKVSIIKEQIKSFLDSFLNAFSFFFSY